MFIACITREKCHCITTQIPSRRRIVVFKLPSTRTNKITRKFNRIFLRSILKAHIVGRGSEEWRCTIPVIRVIQIRFVVAFPIGNISNTRSACCEESYEREACPHTFSNHTIFHIACSFMLFTKRFGKDKDGRNIMSSQPIIQCRLNAALFAA